MKEYAEEKHPSINALATLRENMASENVDWLILYMADAHLSEFISACDRKIEEFSGFSGSAGTLLVSQNECYLWTDSRYFIQAAAELKGSEIVLMKENTSNTPSPISFMSEHIWEGQCIGLELKNICYREYSKLKLKLGSEIEIVDASKIIQKSRQVKIPRVFNEICSFPLETAGRRTIEKLTEIRKIINTQYVNGEDELSYSYIISDLSSVMWLFNLRGSDIDYVPVAYSYAVISDYSATLYLHTKSLSENAKIYLEEEGIIIRDYSFFYKDIEEICTDKILLDESRSNAFLVHKIVDKDSIILTDDNILIRKYIKNSSEITGMKKAAIKDGVTMCRFIKFVKDMASDNSLPNEYELGKILDKMRLEGGSESLSFATICAYGQNAAIVHYEADEENHSEINSSGFLLVDSGGQYTGEGTTDITRTISLGELSGEEKSAYTAVLKGNLHLMNLIFPVGLRGANIDIIAKEPLWEKGLDFYHGTGHGIGCNLEVHEKGVSVSSYLSNERPLLPPLEKGMILSDEPGVYVEGKFGIRLENAIMCVDKSEGARRLLGFEALSYAPFDIDSIDLDELDKKDIAYLNKYHKLVYDEISPYLEENERLWLENATKNI